MLCRTYRVPPFPIKYDKNGHKKRYRTKLPGPLSEVRSLSSSCLISFSIQRRVVVSGFCTPLLRHSTAFKHGGLKDTELQSGQFTKAKEMSTIALPATDEARIGSDSENRGPQKIVLDYILKREPVFQRLAELIDKVSPRFRLSMF